MIDRQIDGSVGIITLNRPEKYNVLDAQGYRDLADAFRDFSEDSRVRVVKVQASGKAFCAGSNIEECLKESVQEFRDHYANVGAMLKAASTCKKPTVAKLHGYALGGGCGLAAACDMAYAAEDTVFGVPEVDLQIFPTTVMPPFFKAMNQKQMFAFLFLGEKFQAPRARELGLITDYCAGEVLDQMVDQIVLKIASTNPVAIQMGKEALLVAREMHMADAYDYLYNIMAMIASSEAAGVRMREFVEEKRRKSEAKRKLRAASGAAV